jgi:KUP system potassium uptake protein
VLCVTGGEALYADMGHFGRYPIRLAWLGLVLPVPAAQLLRPGRADPRHAGCGQQSVLPARAGWPAPMLVLASRGDVIASQALISGTFSSCAQAIQLGYLPRLEIVHTSSDEVSHVYIPW